MAYNWRPDILGLQATQTRAGDGLQTTQRAPLVWPRLPNPRIGVYLASCRARSDHVASPILVDQLDAILTASSVEERVGGLRLPPRLLRDAFFVSRLQPHPLSWSNSRTTGRRARHKQVMATAGHGHSHVYAADLVLFCPRLPDCHKALVSGR